MGSRSVLNAVPLPIGRSPAGLLFNGLRAESLLRGDAGSRLFRKIEIPAHFLGLFRVYTRPHDLPPRAQCSSPYHLLNIGHSYTSSFRRLCSAAEYSATLIPFPIERTLHPHTLRECTAHTRAVGSETKIIMDKPALIAAMERAARQTRFELFSRFVTAAAPRNGALRILDVGGTWAYWQEMDWTRLGRIEVTLLNVFPQDGLPAPFSAVVADGRSLSQYADREIDIVYSNSVLGHVGAFRDQQEIAREMRRVGRSYFIQTPNQRFLLDWRTLVPLFHFLPVDWQAWCIRRFPVGIYPRIPDHHAALQAASRVRNVTWSEFRQLFPEAVIIRERVAGFTKSFVAHYGFPLSARAVRRDVVLPLIPRTRRPEPALAESSRAHSDPGRLIDSPNRGPAPPRS